MVRTIPSSERLCRLPRVLDRVNMSRSWVYAQIKAGLFPPPIHIGPNSVAWLDSEIEAWLEQRIALSRGQDH